MKSLLRRQLLALMLGVTTLALAVPASVPAFARGGDSGNDSSGSSGSGSGNDGSSGSDSDSDSDGDSSGSGSDSDSDGDNSGSGGNDDGPDHDSGDDSDDDNSNDDDDDSSSNSGGRDRQRPEVQLSLGAASLAGVRNGSLVVVDNLGRVLEVEFDNINGRKVVTGKPHGGDAKRNPGPITSIRVVPASQAPVHQ